MKKIDEILLLNAVQNANSISDVMKNLKRADSSAGRSIIKKYIDIYNIETSHFDTHKERYEKNLKKFVKLSNDEIFVEHSTYNSGNKIKNRLYEEGLKERKCELCGQDENWHGKYMNLVLDHINGIHDDNRLENLRIVCPNCNATLPTHCRGNKKMKKKEYNKKKHYVNLSLSQRKVKRPSYEQLLYDIEELGYCGTGRKYGVSDNSIRKWVKFYKQNARFV